MNYWYIPKVSVMEKTYIWLRKLLKQQSVMGHNEAYGILEELALLSSWSCTLTALLEPEKTAPILFFNTKIVCCTIILWMTAEAVMLICCDSIKTVFTKNKSKICRAHFSLNLSKKLIINKKWNARYILFYVLMHYLNINILNTEELVTSFRRIPQWLLEQHEQTAYMRY